VAPQDARPNHLVPATEEEITLILEENGVRTIDEEPAGMIVLQGYGELIRELSAPSRLDLFTNGRL
jgi:hypothetical protein